MPDTEPLVRIVGVAKDYRGLRPLRVARLELREGDSYALLGFDQVTAEVLVDLITGATVPDSGDVTVFGEPTTVIPDADAWLTNLDRFGLLSERAVLVEQFTAAQNLTLPLSLNLERVPDPVRETVRRLGAEVGLTAAELDTAAGALPPLARARTRLGRALALEPRVLLAEHPSAPLADEDTRTFAADLARVVAERGIAALLLTADRRFAAAAARTVLELQPATGALKAVGGWRQWFG